MQQGATFKLHLSVEITLKYIPVQQGHLRETPVWSDYTKKKYDAAHVNSVYNFSRENDIISMTASATAAVVLLSITMCSFAYSN